VTFASPEPIGTRDTAVPVVPDERINPELPPLIEPDSTLIEPDT
jgi:hypothetical protein